jgi:DNA-binding XRE family transcriptional regulator
MLAKNIKKLRTEKRTKQYQLAAMCDFEKASMSRIEAGKTNPTMLTVYKICNALNVPVSELFKI